MLLCCISFLENCKEYKVIAESPEYAKHYGLYERVVRSILKDNQIKWDMFMKNFEDVSNGKFRRDLRHTWSKLGDAIEMMMVYDSMETMENIQHKYFIECEGFDEGSVTYPGIPWADEDWLWKHSYEEDYEREQSYLYHKINEWGQ